MGDVAGVSEEFSSLTKPSPSLADGVRAWMSSVSLDATVPISAGSETRAVSFGVGIDLLERPCLL